MLSLHSWKLHTQDYNFPARRALDGSSRFNHRRRSLTVQGTLRRNGFTVTLFTLWSLRWEHEQHENVQGVLLCSVSSIPKLSWGNYSPIQVQIGQATWAFNWNVVHRGFSDMTLDLCLTLRIYPGMKHIYKV